MSNGFSVIDKKTGETVTADMIPISKSKKCHKNNENVKGKDFLITSKGKLFVEVKCGDELELDKRKFKVVWE